ncbi:XRE family transcriptional regulator [Streptomyces phaeoluteigriseus]|uniref:XRE family transcriptional regulator n=1 Tax=Streptomyces phaeoluteigriseus TaxID=114686 RepID=A0ABY4Z1E3_9ACTN|nr:XRE family transcriptional regulator [Streptomyces phaeoluteigriseus]USQ82795.1 XRE family transcriptional regulator [Streptomyces phaeoluteigriseus]
MTTPSPTPAPALSQDLSAERVRLVSALRDLRKRTDLSLAGLAAKTTFSKSSWERYLNGRTLPPRAAVEELCGLVGEPPGRCLALWELADTEARGRVRKAPTGKRTAPRTALRAAPPPTPSPPVAPMPPAARLGHRQAMALAVLASMCAVVVGAVTLSLLLISRDHATPRATASTGPLCRGTACAGKDPMDMRCADAPTTLLRHRTTGGAWLELRHSRECGASWARMWGTRIGDRLKMTPGARTNQIRNRADADAYVYTPMSATRPGTLVRACLVPADGSDGDGDGGSSGRTDGSGSEACIESRVH